MAYVIAVYDPGRPVLITSVQYYSLAAISIRQYGGDTYGNSGENTQF